MPDSIRCAAYLDKGGTGKTTSIAHFAAALAAEGHDVLTIDLAGKQGDLAKIFGVAEQVDEDDWPNIATVFQPEWDTVAERIESKFGDDPLAELIVATDEGVDLIPAHQGLDSLDIELESKFEGSEKYQQLDQFLVEYVDESYDVVLLDLPGAPNNITYNGVWAAQHLLVPVRAGLLEAEQANALEADLEEFRETGRDVEVTMVLPNMIDTNTNLGNRYLDEYSNRYPDAIAPEPVPDSQDIPNTTDAGETLFARDEDGLLSTAQRAREAYAANATELITRIKP
jgi:chromosome partitioning protein